MPNWASAEAQFIPNFSLHTNFSIAHHLCLGRRSSLERLLSNSRVAFDHQNRHHHHQMNRSNADAGENVFGRITRKYTAQIRKYKDDR